MYFFLRPYIFSIYKSVKFQKQSFTSWPSEKKSFLVILHNAGKPYTTDWSLFDQKYERQWRKLASTIEVSFVFCRLFLSNDKVKRFNIPNFMVENFKTSRLFTDIRGRKIARCEQDCNTFSLAWRTLECVTTTLISDCCPSSTFGKELLVYQYKWLNFPLLSPLGSSILSQNFLTT